MLVGWRPVAVVVVVALAIALTGCGGASRLSKAAYQAKLQSISGSLESSLKKMLPQLTAGGTSFAKYGAALSRVLTTEATAMAKLKPPADAAADNDKLVAGLRYTATLLRARKPTGLSAAIRSSPVVEAMNAATTDLEHKGYTLTQNLVLRQPVRAIKHKGVPRGGMAAGPSTPIDCSSAHGITFYQGKLLTFTQVKRVFLTHGLDLRPLYRQAPEAGYHLPGLRSGSIVLVGLAATCNASPPGFAYLVGSPRPTRVVVRNVDIEYHLSARTARRLVAAIATLRKQLHH
jgi:hypothetical protein